MTIAVARLSKLLATVFTFERLLVLVNAEVVAQVTKLRKLHRAHFAPEHLVHALCGDVELLN